MKLWAVEDGWRKAFALVRADDEVAALEAAIKDDREDDDDEDADEDDRRFDVRNGRVSVREVVDSGHPGVIVSFSGEVT